MMISAMYEVGVFGRIRSGRLGLVFSTQLTTNYVLTLLAENRLAL